MKVYVDEIPKSCSECEWFTPNHCSKNGRNFCLLARMPFYNTKEERQTTRGQHKDSLSDFECPLQSLADYTKQVRKEVCEEIWKEFEKRLINKTKDMPVINVAHLINSVLDQIQGKTNEPLYIRTIDLIKTIYKTYVCGGALHIVLDDDNVEDWSIKWCIEHTINQNFEKYYNSDSENDIEDDRLMFLECAENLLKMSMEERLMCIEKALEYIA